MKVIAKCPACQGELQITALKCADCGMEMRNNFEISMFDRLNREQYQFLISFLRNRGNLKEVQEDLGMSYPTAKRKLDELLYKLDLADEIREVKEVADMSTISVDYSSNKASEIIKAKLKEKGGHVTVYTIQGLPCEIYAEKDGVSFSSDKLPVMPPYDFAVFDAIIDLLLRKGGHAKKGNGRNHKLGEPGCEEDTVVGAVAKHRGRCIGDSVYDPVFVLAAVLEWAGIACNSRGEVVLSEEYRRSL